MSVVICYVSDGLSIVATDTRVSLGYNMDSLLSWSDGNEKLISIENGWIAGVGIHDFIEEFKSEIINNPINNTDEIKKTFNKCYQNSVASNPTLNEANDITALTISWVTVYNQYLRFRIGLLSKSIGGLNQIALIEENNFFVLFPIEYIRDQELMNSFNAKFNYQVTYKGNIDEVLQMTFRMFEEISSNAMTVSEDCDLGINFINSEGINKFKMSGRIDSLISSSFDQLLENAKRY